MRAFLRYASLVAFVVLINGALPAQTVAILDSANTRNYFGAHYPACNAAQGSFYLGADEYQRYFRGWQYVLEHDMGMTPAILGDGDVSEGVLARYRVLILSNTASLSDDEEKTIERWVRDGGRLIATFGSGYKDILFDPREPDNLKKQEGGTSGLHNLWHDPLNKLVTSMALDPFVDILLTNYAGPAACLAGALQNNILHYGGLANLLVQRPADFKDSLASVIIENPGWTRNQPAILSTKSAHGLVVYYAFAPEYLVSKEFGLPAPERCPDGQNWAGRSLEGRLLMMCTIQYLLSAP